MRPCLSLVPTVLLLLLRATIVSTLSEANIEPILTAWGLASLNFAAALWSMTLAQKVAPIPSMLLVFGGGGFRMLLLISSVIAVMLKKAEWFLPFCIALLICFIPFLIVEIAVVYRQGLRQH